MYCRHNIRKRATTCGSTATRPKAARDPRRCVKKMINEILNHRKILSFTIHEKDNCSLSLSSGYSLSIECLVRFVGGNNVFACANDHGHQFGLSVPFDSENKIQKAIANQEIADIEFNKSTGDLNLYFSSGVLQIICNSAGYENYQINGPDGLLIIIHGGKQLDTQPANTADR
jgi:hypothetical protein